MAHPVQRIEDQAPVAPRGLAQESRARPAAAPDRGLEFGPCARDTLGPGPAERGPEGRQPKRSGPVARPFARAAVRLAVQAERQLEEPVLRGVQTRSARPGGRASTTGPCGTGCLPARPTGRPTARAGRRTRPG